jgi:hypothetical protein
MNCIDTRGASNRYGGFQMCPCDPLLTTGAISGITSAQLAVSVCRLPPALQDVIAQQPPNVDRRTGAQMITKHLFPVSHRSLEAWLLPTRHVNGRAVIPTEALFAVAYAKLVGAPIIMSGRRAAAEQ